MALGRPISIEGTSGTPEALEPISAEGCAQTRRTGSPYKWVLQTCAATPAIHRNGQLCPEGLRPLGLGGTQLRHLAWNLLLTVAVIAEV